MRSDKRTYLIKNGANYADELLYLVSKPLIIRFPSIAVKCDALDALLQGPDVTAQLADTAFKRSYFSCIPPRVCQFRRLF